MGADLFVSYNHKDRPAVDAVCSKLKQYGPGLFVDHDTLKKGLPWPQALEEALGDARAVAVFLGPNGLGGWQRREIFFALDRQVAAEKEGREYAVIPVLLQGADPTPSFLMLNHGIDASDGNAARALADAISGTPAADVPGIIADLRPYKGLHAFREEDSAFFFGRTTFADQLSAMLDQQNVVAAVGPSGSGKSSVVFAGLVPRLRRRRPPQRTWEIADFKPGYYPWRNLADALVPMLEPNASEIDRGALASRLEKDITGQASALASTVQRLLRVSGGADRLLIIADQFEELFTHSKPEESRLFIETLFEVTRTAPLSLVLTLRADFYGVAVDSSRTLGDLLGRANVTLGPVNDAELKQIIEGPARLVRVGFEPALVDHIVESVKAQPASLPLLEYALTETWNRATTRSRTAGRPVAITLDDWRNSGELTGAIAKRADALFDSLSDEEQRATRRLFGFLVNVSRDGEESADTRRRALQSEVGEACWAVAQKFAGPDYRLLVTAHRQGSDDATVEVTHEAILFHWARLREWIREDRANLLVEQEVADARMRWDAGGRSDADLLQATALNATLTWAEKNWSTANAATSDFLIRSVARAGLHLERWIPRYAERGDVMALARPYLEAHDPAERIRGLEIVRWIPPDGGTAANAALALALGDEDATIRRSAVETLCGIGALDLLTRTAITEPHGQRKRRALQALGHARNVRGVGRKALAQLPRAATLRARTYGIVDLLSIHRTTFALVFALTSLCFGLAWGLAFRAAIIVLDIAGLPPQVMSPFGELPFALAVSIGVIALLRAIIDERHVTPGYLFATGLIAGLISGAIDIAGRLIEESLRFVLEFFGASRRGALNFMFAFTDQLPEMLAMAIVSLAVLAAATAPPQRTFVRRFVWVSLVASTAAAVVSRLILPLFLTVIGANYDWGDLPRLAVGSALGIFVVTIAAIAGLCGFRLALRMAFHSRPYPDWPVPEPK